jgi:hypothetical protein
MRPALNIRHRRERPDLAMRLAHPRLILLEWGSGYAAYRTDMSTPITRADRRRERGGRT